MIGIDIDKIEQLIKLNRKLLSESKDILNNMNSVGNEFSNLYSGFSLNSIYSIIKQQNTNVSNIYSVLESYLLMFEKLKNTYIKQDSLFGNEINSFIKNIKTN